MERWEGIIVDNRGGFDGLENGVDGLLLDEGTDGRDAWRRRGERGERGRKARGRR